MAKSILLSIKPEWATNILSNKEITEYATFYLIYKIQTIYHNMKERCYNPKAARYARYGGRGIKICDEWLGLKGRDRFTIWAITNGYKIDYSIERIDINKNYCPENCKWIPKNQQSKNTSKTRWIIHNERTMCLQDWCRELGVNPNTIISRARKNGGDYEKALFEYHRPIKNEKTTCPQGHLYTKENTGWNSRGYRYCIECLKTFRQYYNAKHREMRREKENG